MKFEVIADGTTVWVNSNEDGGCVARFGRNGIDIHRTTEEQMRGQPQCRSCTHSKVTLEDWICFRLKVREFYGVEVPEAYRPEYLGSFH